jgi:hypothetical protein
MRSCWARRSFANGSVAAMSGRESPTSDLHEACTALQVSGAADEHYAKHLRILCDRLAAAGARGVPLTPSHVAAVAAAIACACIDGERDASRGLAASAVILLCRTEPVAARKALSTAGAVQAVVRLLTKSKCATARLNAALALATLAAGSPLAQQAYATPGTAVALGAMMTLEDRRAAENTSPTPALALLRAICVAVVNLTSGYDEGRRAFATAALRGVALEAARSWHAPTSEWGLRAVATISAAATSASAVDGTWWLGIDEKERPVVLKMWTDVFLSTANRSIKFAMVAATATAILSEERNTAALRHLWLARALTAVAEVPAELAGSRTEVAVALCSNPALLAAVVAALRTPIGPPVVAAAAAGWTFRFLSASLQATQSSSSTACELIAIARRRAGELASAVGDGLRRCVSSWTTTDANSSLAPDLWPPTGPTPYLCGVQLIRELLGCDADPAAGAALRAGTDEAAAAVIADDGPFQLALGHEAVAIALCEAAAVAHASEEVRAFALETLAALFAASVHVQRRSATTKFRDALVSVLAKTDSTPVLEWLASIIADVATMTSEGQQALTCPAVRAALIAIASATQSKRVVYWAARAVAQLTANNEAGKALMAVAEVRDQVLLRASRTTRDEGTNRWIALAICNMVSSGPQAAALFAVEPVHDLFADLAVRTKSNEVRQALARALCVAGRLESPLVDVFLSFTMHDAVCLMGDMASDDETRAWIASALVTLTRRDGACWRFRVVDALEKLMHTVGSQETRNWVQVAVLGFQAVVDLESITTPANSLDGSMTFSSSERRRVKYAPFSNPTSADAWSALATSIAAECGCTPLQLQLSCLLTATDTWLPLRGLADLQHIDATNRVRAAVLPFEIQVSEVTFGAGAASSVGSGTRDEVRMATVRGRPVVLRKPSLFARSEFAMDDAQALARTVEDELATAKTLREADYLRLPLGVVYGDLDCGSGQTIRRVPLFVAYEHVSANLAQRLSRAIAADDARRIAVCVLNALSYLHERGRVHGHVHERNVLLRGGGAILDGACGHRPAGRRSLAKDVAATRAFLPPEADAFLNACELQAAAAEAAFPAGGAHAPHSAWDMWAFGFLALGLVGAVKEAPLAGGVQDVAVLRPVTQRSIDTVLSTIALPEPWMTVVKGCVRTAPERRMSANEALGLFS